MINKKTFLYGLDSLINALPVNYILPDLLTEKLPRGLATGYADTVAHASLGFSLLHIWLADTKEGAIDFKK